MDLARSTDQLALQDSARRFVADHPVPSWATLADLGWLGLNVGERYGGSAASRAEMAVVFEELGRGAVPGPIFETAILAPEIIRAAAFDAAPDLLHAIAAGTACIVVIGDDFFGGRHSLTVDPAGSVAGASAPRATTGDVTHFLLVGSHSCALVDAGGARIEHVGGFLPQSTIVHFDHTRADVRAVDADRLWTAIARSLPVLSAYQVGSCQAVFEMSNAYSSERVQFGKPIGTFQRVQDHIIQLINVTESARWVTNYAIWNTDTGADDHRSAHVAKAITAEAHVAACTSAHEVHGGIGADLQYGLAKHTHSSRELYWYLGDPRWHRRRLLSLLELHP